MEIKHTIEILTKDIQEIEKLIENLNNYSNPPQIELDLAMSKLRRVYEIIYMISQDRNAAPPPTEKHDAQEAIEELDNDFKEKTNESIFEEEKGSDSDEESSSSMSGAEENVEEPGDESPEKTKPEPIAEPDTKEEAPAQKKTDAKDSAILAEKFAKDPSLNERIAGGKKVEDSSAIKGGPIDSIKRNIGLNDRFLIIRELMNGDNEGFNELILKLDECGNFNDAFKHIESRFPDHLEHEGVKVLINLSRRKFISSGNV